MQPGNGHINQTFALTRILPALERRAYPFVLWIPRLHDGAVIHDFDEECLMQNYILSLAAAVSLGLATPAMAYDSGSLISMQDALGVATGIGLATVSNTEFAGNEWQIEGRDMSGRYMEVDVDAMTGDVLNVDR
jgi:hypothetical protein